MNLRMSLRRCGFVGCTIGEPVSALAVSGIVFALIFGGTLLGMLLRSRLPEHI